MAHTIDEIYKQVLNLKTELELQLAQRRVGANQIQVTTGLSDISERLGLIQAGEFRSGNGVEPGRGFSGVRMGYPPFWYNGMWWNIVGVNNDSLQFGLGADDGKGYFAAGLGIFDSDALKFTGLLYGIQHTATNAGNTRTGRLGMVVPSGSTVPAYQLAFSGPAGSELVTNGGAEAGALTGWTDSGGAWSANDVSPYAGTYSFKHDETDISCPANLVQNISGLSAATDYNLSFVSKSPNGDFTPSIILVWKNGGGAEISRDTLLGTKGSSWSAKSQTYTSPAATASVDITLNPGDSFGDAYFDSISFSSQSIAGNISFIPDVRIEGVSLVVGSAALSTSAVDGFIYIPTCAGTPTGVPATQTGTKAMVYDTTNNLLYIYNGGWKKTTVFA